MSGFCPDTTCSILLNSRCVYYESSTLPNTGIITNDSLQTALQKIDEVVGSGGRDGDRWATTSSTSVLIGLGTKNFFVETGLAYTTAQNVVVSENGVPGNSMEGKVITYDSLTGALSIDVTLINGSGTFNDWEINLQGSSTPIYTGVSPTNVTVGGMPSGTSLTGRTFTSILEEILVDYLLPTFASFSMTGQSTLIEVGSRTKTFTWSTTNSGNVQANSIILRDETNAVNLITGLANDGTESIGVGTVTNTATSTHTWRIIGTNTQVSTFNRDFIVTWGWRKYTGASASTTLNEAAIEALGSTISNIIPITTAFLASATYKYFCWPDLFGSPTAGTGFRDTSTNLAVAMADSTDDIIYSNTQNGWSYGIVSVTNSFGVTTNYRVYRTKNIIGGAITIQVS
jgi:hypothetical protein